MPPVVGFKRSRALWDQTRHSHPHWTAAVVSHVRALLYEIQPVRISAVLSHLPQWRVGGKKKLKECMDWVQQYAPEAIRWIHDLVLHRLTWKHALGLLLCLAYYAVVRWLHATLNAGPIVLIVTMLVLIFTVGLGDDDVDGYSAYSVFNRGFQRLLGSIDENDLVMQHVGGAAAFLGPGPRLGQDNNDVLDPRVMHRNNAHRGRRDVNNPEQRPNDVNDNQGQPPPPPRRTGKKARRRNLDQRREMRRQREAATAMGFRGDHEAAGLENQEAMAMQQLLEEQIAIADQAAVVAGDDDDVDDVDEQGENEDES